MKMSCATAARLLEQTQKDREFLIKKEAEFSDDRYASREKIDPRYLYENTIKELQRLNERELILRHTINRHNVQSRLTVEGQVYSVDELLEIRAQLRERKKTLSAMRNESTHEATLRERLQNQIVNSRDTPYYIVLTYDPLQVNKDYQDLCRRLILIQEALDRHNHNEEFEFDIPADEDE